MYQTHNAPAAAVACYGGPLRFRRLDFVSAVEYYRVRPLRRYPGVQAPSPDWRCTWPMLINGRAEQTKRTSAACRGEVLKHIPVNRPRVR